MGLLIGLFEKKQVNQASEPLEGDLSKGILTLDTDNLTRERRQAV